MITDFATLCYSILANLRYVQFLTATAREELNIWQICKYVEKIMKKGVKTECSDSRTTNAWWLDPTFYTAKTNFIPITNRKSFKMYENFSFLKKNDLVMQNHGQGIESDKIWADSTTQNILKYLTLGIWPICPIGQNIWDMYLKKSSHWVSVVCAQSTDDDTTVKNMYRNFGNSINFRTPQCLGHSNV